MLKRTYNTVINFIYDFWLEIERVFWKIVLKILPDKPVNPDECTHVWEVHEVDYDTVSLNVVCYNCQSDGIVTDPSAKEWSDAYEASMKMYVWDDHSRVTYVKCFADGNTQESEKN